MSSFPCSAWATAADLPESCDTTAIKPATLAEALDFSTFVMFNLTRRRYTGICTDTYRPFNACRARRCTCGDARGLKLPSFPVQSIVSVSIDGQTLDPSEYVLHDRQWLRRRGIESWPCGCDLDDEDRFVVTYTWGKEPPAPMKRAAAILAYEFALAWTPDCANRCRIPKRVTQVTMQGVSYALLDPLTMFDDGKTGVPEVDQIIAAERYGQAKARAVVAVPGAGPYGTRI